MTSLTVENYVKTIYQLCLETPGASAGTGRLAAALAVSPGTVTSMLKTLGESGLATYAPYEGARLTAAGEGLALRVLRRHRLIELFLVKTLGLNWDEVHAEAENMEHAVSDWLVDKIDVYLQFPETDPHGDPIPTADGQVPTASHQALPLCPSGARFRLARVLDQSPDFLRYLTARGIQLGCDGQVLDNQFEAGVLTVRVDGAETETSLGHRAAEKLLVTRLPTP